MVQQSQDSKKEDKGYFAQTPRIVRTQYKDLSHTEKWLYTCLKDLCGDKGTCFRSLRTLEEETDISKASLSSMIPHLHSVGLIHAEKKSRGYGGKEVWHIVIIDIWQANKKYCSENEQSPSRVVQILNKDVQKMNKDTESCSENERSCSNFRDRRRPSEGEQQEGEKEKENTDALPAFALTSKQIAEQNERRSNEIWTLIETELHTTFSKSQRASQKNLEGMQLLLGDDTPDTDITKALKNLDAFEIRKFNLQRFFEILPGLKADVPAKLDSKGMLNGHPTRVIDGKLVETDRNGIPVPDRNKIAEASKRNLEKGLADLAAKRGITVEELKAEFLSHSAQPVSSPS